MQIGGGSPGGITGQARKPLYILQQPTFTIELPGPGSGIFLFTGGIGKIERGVEHQVARLPGILRFLWTGSRRRLVRMNGTRFTGEDQLKDLVRAGRGHIEKTVVGRKDRGVRLLFQLP